MQGYPGGPGYPGQQMPGQLNQAANQHRPETDAATRRSSISALDALSRPAPPQQYGYGAPRPPYGAPMGYGAPAYPGQMMMPGQMPGMMPMAPPQMMPQMMMPGAMPGAMSGAMGMPPRGYAQQPRGYAQPAAPPSGPPPIPQYTPSAPLQPKPAMPAAWPAPAAAPAPAPAPGLLQPTPYAPPPQQAYAPAPAPQPTGAVDLFGLPVAAPPLAAAPPAPGDSWGLEGLDLSAGPAPPAPAPVRQRSNEWPAPEGVDPAVWAQLPEAMQRELILQRGGQAPGRNAPAPAPQRRRPTTGGADAYRVQKSKPAHATKGVVQIECLARCSLRTLKTKVWKPAVVIVKGHRELLVFRTSSDWAQYRTASVHRGGDLVQAMKAVTPLIKLHVMLGGGHATDDVKAKEYKTFGGLHHFTLVETKGNGDEKVIAKFASRGARECLDLRGAINAGIRNARGGSSFRSGGPAQGRYAPP